MATKTHSFYYSLILEGSEDSGKRDKNHVQNTDEVSSALTAQNVRSLRKKKENRSDILSTCELVSQMRMTKSKHLDLTIWKS